MRTLRWILLPALVLAAASCVESTSSELGGEYIGTLDSPFSVEGAAVIDLTSADLRSVSAPGRILVAQGTSERTVRILVINPPRNQSGGPISFRVRMTDGAVPPSAEVVAVAGALNQRRDFVGGYAVRFARPDGDPAAPRTPVTTPRGPIPFTRLVAPFFPGGGQLTAPEVFLLDVGGNGNQIYDPGDLRAYLALYPGEIPPETTWSR